MLAIASLINFRFCFAGLSDFERRILPFVLLSKVPLDFSPHK
jgi:hypothetical protein